MCYISQGLSSKQIALNKVKELFIKVCLVFKETHKECGGTS